MAKSHTILFSPQQILRIVLIIPKAAIINASNLHNCCRFEAPIAEKGDVYAFVVVVPIAGLVAADTIPCSSTERKSHSLDLLFHRVFGKKLIEVPLFQSETGTIQPDRNY